MKINLTIKKLQKALMMHGVIYNINTYQFFSEQQQRFITGYRITQKQEFKRKNGKKYMKNVELVNTCSQIEVLKWFVEEWKKAEIKSKDK